MGICNITKDSFSDGGKNYKKNDALKNIKLMLNQGAAIIDIGAESTRPGSEPISYNEEIKRIEPVLKVLPKNKFIISIDTNKTETQEFVLQKGAHIINDIFGGNKDLFDLTKKYHNGLILMHTPAPPKIMQRKTKSYNNVIEDIKKFFVNKLKFADKVKIPHKKIWLDPGIGFGKNLKQNLIILNKIDEFKLKNCGIAIGSSRKSWINNIDGSSLENRIGGSLASVLYCLNKGVNIFRVHDVQETQQAIKIYNKIKCSK
tara:strand:+ start:998 stop:1774 length:777 start_codon:yes stop_codon:yes gene_type:complete